MPDYSLRPVTPEDGELLHRIYASTREEELAPVPWTAEQKSQFLRAQSTAQNTEYRRAHPDADYLIIESRARPAGRLYVRRDATGVHVIDIALLPEFRRAGIGRALLESIQAEAAAAGKSVTIHVERMNPALRLYERLGFKLAQDKGVYWLLRWTPGG